MDEMLVKLFTRHPPTYCFEGNSSKAFCAFIAGKEYGPNKMPEMIRLYRGWYTIMFRPGESSYVVCACEAEC